MTRFWYVFIVSFLITQGELLAQADSTQGTYSFSVTLVDSFSLEPCPFVNIYNHSQQQALLSDLNGHFELSGISLTDSISLQSTGYKSLHFLAERFVFEKQVYLIPEGNPLEEVIVLADDRHLYKWMETVFAEKQETETAKTYIQVETFLNQTQVELVESYYNATVKGSAIESLTYKNGRIALEKSDNTSFLSTETSKAILQLRLNTSNDYLPETPFQYRSKRMRKAFKLTLNATYTSSTGHAIYVISFQPRNPENSSFSGTIWLDTVTKRAEKLTLNAFTTTKHPFLPISSTDSILSVTMEINYVFDAQAEFQRIDFIYFNYQLEYCNRDRDRYEVSTNVVVHPYDYTSTFIPPHFDRKESQLSDYRKIHAFPYNKEFWEEVEHPISQENSEQNEQFFTSQSTILTTDSVNLLNSDPYQRGFFESEYYPWGKRRIVFINTLNDTKTSTTTAQILSEQYELTAQIYLDINVFDGKIDVISATILDPYKTYYKLPLDSMSDCFLNLYLDIVEIERRKFMGKLQLQTVTVDELEMAYQQLNSDIQTKTDLYFKEVAHGSNRRGMEKWNRYVYENLGIDNFFVFKLHPI